MTSSRHRDRPSPRPTRLHAPLSPSPAAPSTQAQPSTAAPLVQPPCLPTPSRRSTARCRPAPSTPPSHRALPGSSRLGRWALLLALAAAGISLVASAILGVTAGPAKAATGSYFGDDAWYTNLGVTLFSVQALCTVAGLTGLVLGIVAAVSDRGRTLGIIATAVAVVAPIVSFALFLILSFAFL